MNEKLLGKCGFYCGCCPTYIKGNCRGCINEHTDGDCFTRDCVLKKGIEACGFCENFPCNELFIRPKCTVLDKNWLEWKKERKMNSRNEELEKLKEQIDRKHHFEKRIENLKLQQNQLQRKVSELEAIKNKEQIDVDKLEGRSLAAFFYAIRGKKEEILEAERKEAYMAAIKFDAANQELQAIEEDIAECKAKLQNISDCESRYENLMAEKIENVKETDPETAVEIENWEKDISNLKSREKELLEAIEAGKNAQRTAESVYKTLSKAEDMSTWDLFGGGLIADLSKHDHLDNAQSQLEILQVQLRRFKTELSDVKINADIKVNIDGFLGFADFFFDGLFADLTVRDKIKNSIASVCGIESQIRSVIIKLESDLEATKIKRENAQKYINEIALKS